MLFRTCTLSPLNRTTNLTNLVFTSVNSPFVNPTFVKTYVGIALDQKRKMALIGIIFGAFLCLYLVHYVKRYFWDYRDMKGPSVFLSVPIIGHAWALSPNPHKTLEDLKTTYGNLFRFDIGPYPSLVVAGLEEFQEMCRMDVFNGRFFGILPAVQTVFGTDSRGEVFGVSASNGQTWAEQRKFMHQNLNVAGMGKKSTLEDIINQEAEIAAERMASGAKNGPVCIKKFFPVAINNIVWRMITGNTSSQDDPLMLYLTDRMNRHFESLSPSNITAILQQYFHRFTNILDKLNMPTCFKDLYIIREFLDNEFKKIDPDPNGLYVAKFKAEIQAAASNPQSSFHGTDGEFHLSGHAVDLFVAGTETTSTVLEWVIWYLIGNPDMQERMFQELDKVFGAHPPTLDCHEDLPFTQAFLLEVNRHSPMALTSVPRFNSSPVTFRGIHIPKHTQILPCLSTINHDPKNFSDPYKFDPERFLDANGKFVRNDHVVIFGLGKRKCVGDVLAKAEIFLFVAQIVLRFKLTPATPISKEIELGLAIRPAPFSINAMPRV